MTTREYRELPIELVDEPDAPTRQSIENADVLSLAESIAAQGQLQPGGVVPNGPRFSVVYGHMRLLACRAAGLDVYIAYVYASTSEAMLAAQLHENVKRKQLNPADEAFWFAQVADGLTLDTDGLAAALDSTREYVERRLNLLRGDPAVLAALQRGAIKVGVAERLNAYANDGDRAVLLDAAIAGGASERLVASWIAERKSLSAARGELPAVDQTHVTQISVADYVTTMTCVLCGSDKHPYLMVPLYVHSPCKDILDAILARHGGVAHAAARPADLDR